MSDWFRWYDDALDEPRLQYAINKNPAVVAVWIWVLSQCAKKKQDHIDEICNATLLGVSHKLGIGAGVFNDCITILQDIHYIEKSDCGYKVRKWNDLQSEYMRHKKAGYCTSKSASVRTQYVQCTDSVRQEERRGEERRLEEDGDSDSQVSRASKSDSVTEKKQASHRIYNLYPRKVGKPAALKAIVRALKDTNEETLVAKTEAYARAVKGMEAQFIPHPATWYGQRRFEDDPETWNTSKPKSSMPKLPYATEMCE